MRRQTLAPLRSLLCVTIATLIVLGVTNSVLAQKKPSDKYPKPDFSAMEEYWEVVEYEYDYTTMVPEFVVIAKPKQKVVPLWWKITWLDGKGVKVGEFAIMFNGVDVQRSKVGDPIRGVSYAPFKRRMPEVKSVIVTERSDSPEEKTGS